MKRQVCWAAVFGILLVARCGDGDPASTPQPNQWTMLGYDHRSSYTNATETAVSVESAPHLGPLWQFEARGQVYGAPVVVGDAVYVAATGAIYAFDGDSGAIRWQITDFGTTSSLAYSEGTLFVHDARAVLRALSADTGEQLWETRTDSHPLAAGTSSPIVVERYVVVGVSSNEIVREGATFRGGVAAFDRHTGELLWRNYTADPPHNGAAVWSTVFIDGAARMVFAGSGQHRTDSALDRARRGERLTNGRARRKAERNVHGLALLAAHRATGGGRGATRGGVR
jgi:hypothetical protein